MNTSIIKTITKTAKSIGITCKKHSPEILVVAGAVGTVVSAVMACKATTKVQGILDETKTRVDAVHQVMDDPDIPEEKYSSEDSRKDLTIIYAQTGLKIVKLYAPSVILGALSMGAMLTSNNILRKRNIALTAAYATVDKAFKEYRGRVVEQFGSEVDKRLRFNIKAQEVEETKVNTETGEVTTEKKIVNVVDPNNISEYAKIFDEANPFWEKDSEYNRRFLQSRQAFLNNRLHANGYLFLNDVYKELGFEPTRAGQVVGWVVDKDNDGDGDTYVDFGIFNMDNPRNSAFVNGYERSIILDFNVEGTILDKVKF